MKNVKVEDTRNFALVGHSGDGKTSVGEAILHLVRLDAKHAIGDLRGNGELLNLTFVPLVETEKLDMPRITAKILGDVDALARRPPRPDPRRKVPFYRHIGGAHVAFME